MPVIIAALWGAAISVAGSLAVQAFLALGIGVVTYTGVNATLTWLKTSAVTAALGLGPQVLGMLSTMKVGTCISIIFSATIARMTLKGFSSDSFKSFVKK